MSEDDKYWITDNHNQKRTQVALGEVYGQPSASNINYLVIIHFTYLIVQYLFGNFQWWDDDLANDAAIWASQCPSDHSGNGHGENIHWTAYSRAMDQGEISQVIRNAAVNSW